MPTFFFSALYLEREKNGIVEHIARIFRIGMRNEDSETDYLTPIPMWLLHPSHQILYGISKRMIMIPRWIFRARSRNA